MKNISTAKLTLLLFIAILLNACGKSGEERKFSLDFCRDMKGPFSIRPGTVITNNSSWKQPIPKDYDYVKPREILLDLEYANTVGQKGRFEGTMQFSAVMALEGEVLNKE